MQVYDVLQRAMPFISCILLRIFILFSLFLPEGFFPSGDFFGGACPAVAVPRPHGLYILAMSQPFLGPQSPVSGTKATKPSSKLPLKRN